MKVAFACFQYVVRNIVRVSAVKRRRAGNQTDPDFAESIFRIRIIRTGRADQRFVVDFCKLHVRMILLGWWKQLILQNINDTPMLV